jgi:predicted RNA-binding Zn ribbon-like protein
MNGTELLRFVNAPLRGPSDLRRHDEVIGGVDDEMALRAPEFEDLRSAIEELLEVSAGGGPLPAAAVRRLNEASERVPRTIALDARGGVVERELSRSMSASALAEIARAAITLLGSADRDRVRRCPSCGDRFLASRLDRRWCSAACGNRARVARHYARRRAASDR